MRDLNQHTTDVTDRRSFFGRIAAMSALGLFGFATTTARAQPAHNRTARIGRERSKAAIGKFSTSTTSTRDLRSASQTTSSHRTSPRRLS